MANKTDLLDAQAHFPLPALSVQADLAEKHGLETLLFCPIPWALRHVLINPDPASHNTLTQTTPNAPNQLLPVYKGAYLAYTSIVSHSMLLLAEEKNGCKRGSSCVSLNMKKLLKLKLRSQTSIHKRRATEP